MPASPVRGSAGLLAQSAACCLDPWSKAMLACLLTFALAFVLSAEIVTGRAARAVNVQHMRHALSDLAKQAHSTHALAFTAASCCACAAGAVASAIASEMSQPISRFNVRRWSMRRLKVKVFLLFHTLLTSSSFSVFFSCYSRNVCVLHILGGGLGICSTLDVCR